VLNEQALAQLRSRFPILSQKTYLYNCSQGALSDAAESGMRSYLESWRTSSAPWNDWVDAHEGLRIQFAQFINAHPDEIAVVPSATAGINAVANAIPFKDGRPNVIMGEYEFPTMGQIFLAQQPRGAHITFLEGGDTPNYERAVNEQTAIVPLTQVSFINGFRADVPAITRLAHAHGAYLFLDGYQDCGTRPIDVRALDVDFYVSGTLKYLLGPPGVAFLYVKRPLIEAFQSTITSWMAQRDVFAFNTQTLDPAPTARRFDGGSPPMPSIYTVRESLKLIAEIGLANIASQISHLTQAFTQGVRSLGIASKTADDNTTGPLVVLRSTDAGTVATNLAAQGVLVSARRDGVRFSFHVYNNLTDVETALSALKSNLHLMVRR
jgi:selenocysteine lyase/cysteine desulfurase